MFVVGRISHCVTALFIGLFIFFACSAPLSVNSQIKDRKSQEYKIKRGDVISVSFAEYPALDQKVFVYPEGTIRLFAVGKLRVANLTISNIEKMVMEKYSQLVSKERLVSKELLVSVNVLDSKLFNVYIGGEINKPGVIRFKGALNVVQGILLAGGLKDLSVEYEVVIFRNDETKGVKIFQFHVKKNINNNKYREFRLAPFDVVFVMKPSGKYKQQGMRTILTI
ncbi:MAG: polysaccharide biosynthesis/export family protein [bacterium]